MPSKKTKTPKKRTIKEIKSKKKIIEKKSELENEIQEEGIPGSTFVETVNLTESPAPSLRKILVQDSFDDPTITPLTSGSFAEKEEEQRGIYTSSGDSQKYSLTANNEDNNPKYENNSGSPILETTNSMMQSPEFSMQSKDERTQNNNSLGINKDTLEQKRREPFEVQETKYEDVRL
jgi:hypothetical protein